jgi:uncharacterized protein (DUF305 family)
MVPGEHRADRRQRALASLTIHAQETTDMNRHALSIAAIAATVAVAGCGTASTTSSSTGSSSTPSPAASAVTGDHNPADVSFAQGMIPHHQQAIAMAKLAATRAASPEVKTLATQIQSAQDPEINQMTGWLTAWGAPTTMPGMTGVPGPTMGAGSMGSMPGMMSDADMGMMSGLTGAAFDRQWLTMMTAHHQGAIAMAHTEQANGRYGPAKTMADNIVRTQTDEVTKMASVLNSLPPGN